MPLGYILTAAALAATLAAVGLFSASRGNEYAQRWARALCALAALSILAASGYLIYLIAAHQFQVAYVAEYSSRRSASQYLVAAFWGGQEGSILLWAMWTGVIGAMLAYRAGGKASGVWPIFGLMQSALLVLCLVKSPFALGSGPVPADGAGLNPLLENPWMVVHPPVLFLGFAAMSAPWAWALYGMIHRDWDGWARRAYSWVLFAFAIQGLGVALGGYWAYETLGWGGFWGWDPVEVSSFVPWLLLIASLHLLPVQREKGVFRAGNLLLATMPFAAMCYGTFLTRSGLLADFSVHSFSSLGAGAFDTLAAVTVAAFVVPVVVLIVRWRSLPKPSASPGAAPTRETVLFAASALYSAIGLVAVIGMSAPLITKLWIAKGAAAQPDFYNRAVYPLAIAMLIGMAAAPLSSWRGADRSAIGRGLLPAYLAALAVTVAAFFAGLRTPWMLLLFGAGAFAALSNMAVLIKRAAKRRMHGSFGALIAHIGAALLLIGIACLVTFSQQALHIVLIKNQPTSALGYRLTYLGMTSQPYDRSNAIEVRVSKGKQSFIATPHLFIAPWGGSDQVFADPPDIHNFAWGDLYLAHYRGPTSMDPSSPIDGVQVSPGAVISFGGYKFVYHGLKWSDQVHAAMASSDLATVTNMSRMQIYGMVDVTYRGRTYHVRPSMIFDRAAQSQYSVPARLPGAPNAILTLDDVQMPSGATLSTSNLPDPLEAVQVDFSTKPMIDLVWIGALLYTIGGLAAYRRRARQFDREAAESGPDEPTQKDAPPKSTPKTKTDERRHLAGAGRR